jgi:hypothetical protein
MSQTDSEFVILLDDLTGLTIMNDTKPTALATNGVQSEAPREKIFNLTCSSD